ncbi:MAG: hypothetical protein ACO1TE_00940 [Prosthecobacter sp.]
MTGKQELCLTIILSGMVLFFLALPFAASAAWDRWQMREFLENEGSFLSASDTILSLSYSKAIGDTTICCRFRSKSPESFKFAHHGHLPEVTRAMALATVDHRHPPSCLLPDWEGDFDYSHGWLVLYDRKQDIGWFFVSH